MLDSRKQSFGPLKFPVLCHSQKMYLCDPFHFWCKTVMLLKVWGMLGSQISICILVFGRDPFKYELVGHGPLLCFQHWGDFRAQVALVFPALAFTNFQHPLAKS